MGEIGLNKPLQCLICDSDVQINHSYSIFYTFITSTGVLLANCIENNLSLKDIGSLSLRSTFLCLKCFEYLDQLSEFQSKIVKLKAELWAIFKSTCEKYGDPAEALVKGASTQTDNLQCFCKNHSGDKVSTNVTTLKMEYVDSEAESMSCFDDATPLDVEEPVKLEKTEATLKKGEEITVEADLHFDDDESGGKWKRRPESCKLCGKWFKKVVELNSHMLLYHMEMSVDGEKEDENGEVEACGVEGDDDEEEEEEVEEEEEEGSNKKGKRRKRKLHTCSICRKTFWRPCALKEHMSCHASTTPFICKQCGKKLKSRTGAVYHIMKTHKIHVGRGKDAEVEAIKSNFYVDVLEDDEIQVETQDVKEDRESHGNTSSSEDELPLARRRKEFIFEKIKKEVLVEGDLEKKEKVQKQALQTLKKCCDVSVTKVPKSKSEERKKSSKKTRLTVPEEPVISSAVQNIEDDEIRCKITGLSVTNQVTIHTKSEASNSDGGEFMGPDMLPDIELGSEKPKTRRKYPLSVLQRMKRQKETSMFPVMKEPKFKCDMCGKLWKTRGELNAHKITHSDARPYICEICGQAYKHKPALDVHVGMHRGIYHHQCPFCQKAFTQKGALQRHLPIHTGDLPYQCELCGKRFVHRTSFSIHTMAHTGVRNIRCKVCNLGVLSKSHLRRHMRIHTGEKPYDCQTCGKAFAERYNLVAHQRIHDPNLVGPARQQKKRGQTCRLCNATFDRRHKLEEHMVAAHNKVVEETPRSSLLDASDGFYTALPPRLGNDRKMTGREDMEEKSAGENPNDLARRNLQSIQSLRSLELLRNLENSRNLELIRMANGMGGMETSAGPPWAAYVNPGS